MIDVQDFSEFYRENYKPVYRYVYNKVGHREEAEDLTTQIFLKAACGVELQRAAWSTRTWVFQVARTTIADYWRSYYRRETSISLESLLEAGWEGSVKETSLESESAADIVQDILQILPERDREVLTSRFLLHLSIRETAAKMGLTETTIKVAQFRALRRAAHVEYITVKVAK